MTKAEVFTPRSLHEFARLELPLSWEDGEDQVYEEAPVASVMVDGFRFHVHKDDGADVRRAVVIAPEGEAEKAFRSLRKSTSKRLAKRMSTFLELAREHYISLPPSWGVYKAGSLSSFYAMPRDVDPAVPRWIAEVVGTRRDVCFWRVTTTDAKKQLDNFFPEEARVHRALARWERALASSASLLAGAAPTEGIQPTLIELGDGRLSQITEGRDYDAWLPELTTPQRDFVTSTGDRSIRLTGAAGTGKTLALELRAIHVAREAFARGETPRILFLTHSWALAAQVDSDLEALDPSLSRLLEVVPLLSLAYEGLPGERRNLDLQLVGDDSADAKALQIEVLDEIWADFKKGDWLTYRGHVSTSFKMLVEDDSPEAHRALVRDTLLEIGCVLGAEGVFPGVGAEARYLGLKRAPWMMQLENAEDQRVILEIYRRYYALFLDQQLITSDQVTSDYLNYLETFAWNVRRRDEGFDYLFVDELHLFNPQERLVLSYLSRDPDSYPRLYLAVDPRQSPTGRFAGAGDIDSMDDGGLSTRLGGIDSQELSVIHRYTPQILRLVQHINDEFPQLELGEMWQAELSAAQSSGDDGPTPLLLSCGTRDAEATAVYDAASERAKRSPGRVAIAVIEEELLQEFEGIARGVATRTSRPLARICGRDELDPEALDSRAVVVGPAEFLAGLQFESVVIAGCNETAFGVAHSQGRRRHFLSLLYLAVSRAEKSVHIAVNDEVGGVPAVLERAIERGVCEMSRREV